MITRTPFHVIIIGAGTGGLCLAHGLTRAGISVAVYERDRTRMDGLQGYRVGISPDGSRALRACLPPELFATFVATCARTPRSFNMYTEGLREIGSFDTPFEDDALSEHSVSRMTLRQVLLIGMEGIVQFDKVFERYEQHADGTVVAHFADGTTATGDLLVAADGTNSRVRRQYLPHAALAETGILSVGGKVALTDETRALLPPKALDGLSLVMAPKGYGGIIHVMEFKWDRGGVKTGIGGNDADVLARWPGLLYDNTRDHIIWGLWGARQNLPADPTPLRGDDLVRFALQVTEGWSPNLRQIIAASDPASCFPINVRTSVPVSAWETTNVTLLGDAIHTMTPGRGVGANTALRDAALICRNLTAALGGRTTVRDAIRDYEREMLRYGTEAVEKSLEQMNARDPIHRPIVGRLMLAGMRTGMCIVNAVPPLKRRAAAQVQNFRDADRERSPLPATPR